MAETPLPKRAASSPQRKQQFTLDAYTGHLFVRDEKKNDRCPDCDGTIRIGDRTFEIAGWFRKSERGNDYIFLRIGAERF